ncbi:MAG: hypothetical protein WB526_06375 [Candidatus Cybelea sp.]
MLTLPFTIAPVNLGNRYRPIAVNTEAVHDQDARADLQRRI